MTDFGDEGSTDAGLGACSCCLPGVRCFHLYRPRGA